MSKSIVAILAFLPLFIALTAFLFYFLRLKKRENEALNFGLAEIFVVIFTTLPWLIQAMRIFLLILDDPKGWEHIYIPCGYLLIIYSQITFIVVNWVLRRPEEAQKLSPLRAMFSTFLAAIVGLTALFLYWVALTFVIQFFR